MPVLTRPYADWKTQNTVFTGIAAYERFKSNGDGASDVFLRDAGACVPIA